MVTFIADGIDTLRSVSHSISTEFTKLFRYIVILSIIFYVINI